MLNTSSVCYAEWAQIIPRNLAAILMLVIQGKALMPTVQQVSPDPAGLPSYMRTYVPPTSVLPLPPMQMRSASVALIELRSFCPEFTRHQCP